MDCLRLLENLDNIGYTGMCIGAENSILLRNSLLILQKENHFHKCYYWGRIDGVKNDYFIAYGHGKDCLNSQVYYYSFDRMNWLLMPKTNAYNRCLTPFATSQFQGIPGFISKVYNLISPFPPNKDFEKYLQGSVSKELKEEDRLAAIVEQINEDAMIIPRGGWQKTVNGDIIENANFQGLSLNESEQLNFYQHARLPQRKWKTNLLTRHDYNYSLDFLDTIDADIPKGCWCLQKELGGRLVILMNGFWPGAAFYHKINSSDYGFMYVGPGKKNLDLPFMI
ncbi:radial spoke head protein 9 homolog [Leptopilina heterotoma]|uniref:radial spoke head protein 9 homolog n=1 Tax=Leptopilina heterotoma TaxID=63436 RepID=UPI001CA7BD4B|nr:radial spoke head protein 9 homolog [Leptopilina heterotoma]